MYFRKTVHRWCVGSSWIDLPVRVFINCLFTLEMPQEILKFKKVSDIVIVIAGMKFVSVTQYSLHFGKNGIYFLKGFEQFYNFAGCPVIAGNIPADISPSADLKAI